MSVRNGLLVRGASLAVFLFALALTLGQVPSNASSTEELRFGGKVPPASASVQRYGARPDDGRDDTAAIQKALDMVKTGVVVVPRGTYDVSGINVRRSITLQLASGARLLLSPRVNGPVVRITADGAILEGGAVDGNRGQQSGGQWAGAVTVFANNVTVRRVTVDNAYGIGILARGADRVAISSNRVRHSGNIGIFVEPIAPRPVRGITVASNKVDRTGEGATISEGGIKIHGVKGSPAKITGLTVTSNVVRLPERPGEDAAIAIEIWGNVSSATVRFNRTYGGSMGISLDDSIGTVEKNVVFRPSLYGIELASSVRSTVARNTVFCLGLTQTGIVLANESSTDNQVADNYVVGCTKRGIQANAGAERLEVVNNTIIGPSEFLLEVIASSDVRLLDNHLDGQQTSQVGIVIDSAPRVTVERNFLCRIGSIGVQIHADEGVALDYVVVRNNVFAGVIRQLSVELSGGATRGTGFITGPNTSTRAAC